MVAATKIAIPVAMAPADMTKIVTPAAPAHARGQVVAITKHPATVATTATRTRAATRATAATQAATTKTATHAPLAAIPAASA